ncbi:response regulator [Eubacterium sp. am_0171]|uniref:Stage 0 sporulation protein A homolog n=1 Tax=Faecalicatena contorta TaxID=39482 RepID=A0A174L6S3_9FIRM|nr:MULTISPECIES: response regulator [Clostridia]MBS6765885.1 response regulator [Clostridium sp.]MSC85884.1 response regulator [Eubacterium sp. BIOML-A1]MSD08232.1 response regulator [Eubacterium sp. BIOML-A2]MDU7708735.1 response regulator [Clostridium sp.]RYT12777.1 response regulator [Eubacterium sp. am_0171]
MLLDLLLPGKDGIHVLEELLQGGFTGKVIMISQVDDEAMMEKAYERGIMFYISKPLNAIEVISVISNVAKLVSLQKSMETIQGALMGIQEAPPVSKGMLGDRFQKICTDIGIWGMKGIDELKTIVFTVMEFQKKEKSYQIKEVYEKVAGEMYGEEQLQLNKKALEQRIRRIMQKALDNIAQMGAEDYYDPIFADYANLLFDFGQVRIKMRNLKDQSVEPGRISSKKFIEGFLLRMTAQ